jgi:hypothetical protein
MVLVVRKDLGMSPGKIAAQCVHAALGAYREASSASNGPALDGVAMWESQGQHPRRSAHLMHLMTPAISLRPLSVSSGVTPAPCQQGYQSLELCCRSMCLGGGGAGRGGFFDRGSDDRAVVQLIGRARRAHGRRARLFGRFTRVH